MIADHTLDITRETCPMTYVRVRLALDRMASGQTLLVRLQGADPVRNVPEMARAQGHAIVDDSLDETGVMTLVLRKG
jgi:TusA-related sulfurtransferase